MQVNHQTICWAQNKRLKTKIIAKNQSFKKIKQHQFKNVFTHFLNYRSPQSNTGQLIANSTKPWVENVRGKSQRWLWRKCGRKSEKDKPKRQWMSLLYMWMNYPWTPTMSSSAVTLETWRTMPSSGVSSSSYVSSTSRASFPGSFANSVTSHNVVSQ